MDADLFLQTLTKELLTPAEYNDVSGVSLQLEELAQAIEAVRSISERALIDSQTFFRIPGAHRLAELILGVPARDLSREFNEDGMLDQLAESRYWTQGESIRGVVVGLLLAEAHRSRKERRRRKFEEVIFKAFRSALATEQDNGLYLQTNVRIADVRTFDFVIADNQGPCIAVATVFHGDAGGRQGDLLRGLVDLQLRLSKLSIPLLIIADGAGFASMKSLVRDVFPQLDFVANLKSIEEGALPDLILSAFATRERLLSSRTQRDDDKMTSIAKLTLSAGQAVTPQVLGVDPPTAGAFLLRYRASHPDYAVLSDSGMLEAEATEGLRETASWFDSSRRRSLAEGDTVVRLLANWLGWQWQFQANTDLYIAFALSGLSVPLRVPDRLPLLVNRVPDANRYSELFDAIDQMMSRGNIGGRIAILIDPFRPEESRQLAHKLSIQRRVQIAVLSEGDIKEIMLRNREAGRRLFMQVLLRNADLSLVSPFVAEGPTPEDMFFGREVEIRRVIDEVKRHSFALVGGRKAGKTSMLQRLKVAFGRQGHVCYIDSQAHPDREDFLEFLCSQISYREIPTGGDLASHAESIIRSFLRANFGDAFGVLLIDEVDDLFLGDATDTHYPHVLSRALRAVSQARLASIVVTGERALFSLTRDASSPHWNFCTPLQIGPLDEDAGRRLLREPLASLGVNIDDQALQYALEETACHPNLLQFFGTRLVELLSPLSRNGQALRVDLEMVRDICDSSVFSQRFVRTFWSQATILEKFLSTRLDFHQPRTMQDLSSDLQGYGVSIPASEMEMALAFLELYAIIISTPGGFRYRSHAFGRLRIEVAPSMVDEWLQLLGKR